MAYTYATATVKGGMPVHVEGAVNRYREDWGYDIYVEIEAVCWSNTGNPVTKNFENSLTDRDWDSIREALIESVY